eukprot:jgi/Hompol1/3140/HPOL_006360-RA
MNKFEGNLLAFSSGLALALLFHSIYDNVVESQKIHSDHARRRRLEAPAKPEDGEDSSLLFCCSAIQPLPSSLSDAVRAVRAAPAVRAVLLSAAAAISLEAIAELCKAGSPLLRESSIHILYERAMSEEHLPYIIKACTARNNPAKLRMGILVLRQLAMEDENKPILIKMRALKILVKTLTITADEDIQRFAASATYSLIINDDKLRSKVVKYGILDALFKFLEDTPRLSTDVKYWSLLLISQIVSNETLHPVLLDRGIVSLLARMARLTFSNANMQKLCLHSLVRLVSAMQPTGKLN